MKRFLTWLETKFSRHSAAVAADERHTPAGVRPMENAKEEYSVEVAFDAEVPGQVKGHELGKNVLIPDEYVSDDTTEPELSILDESSPDASESTGFDPYDTGRFDTSKT